MRQVITLDHFWKYHQQAKTDSQRTEHFQLATDKIAEPNRNIKMVYKKKNTNKPIFYSTKIGTVLVNQRCCVLLFSESLSIHRPTSRKPWREKKCKGQTDRQADRQTDRKSNRDMEIEMLQSLLIQQAGALMAECEIQVTIHTGTIVCDAFCWWLMSHSGYVGPLFCSYGEGIWSV